jgi:hypothetical protein
MTDWNDTVVTDLFGEQQERTAALNAIDRQAAAHDAAVAARVAKMAEHPTVKAIAAASERTKAARAAAAARAATAVPLPPALTSCEKQDRVQHRRSGWVGTACTVTRDGWVFVKVAPQPGFIARFSAWFSLADLCEPGATAQPADTPPHTG